MVEKRKRRKSQNPLRERTVPMVAKRLGVHDNWLRRAVSDGEVKTELFGGVVWITPAEEARLAAMLKVAREPLAEPLAPAIKLVS